MSENCFTTDFFPVYIVLLPKYKAGKSFLDNIGSHQLSLWTKTAETFYLIMKLSYFVFHR